MTSLSLNAKPPVSLRLAKGSDLDEIMRLEHKGFSEPTWETRETFAGRLSSFNDGFWVISEMGGKLHGYLCAEIWRFSEIWDRSRFTLNHCAGDFHIASGEEVYVSSMTIDNDSRGQGVGRSLFTGALMKMFEAYPNLRSTILMVSDEWKHAKKIYGAVGFVEIGSINRYFTAQDNTQHRAIIMRRGGKVLEVK